MTIKTDLYQVTLRFPRLFPDRTLFEDQIHLANRYLLTNGISREQSDLICQSTEEFLPVDDRGNPSSTSGIAKFPLEGKMILAEYMSNANVRLEYADFGTGLAPSDHSRLWTKGKIGELRFELREFKHQPQTLNIPDISELYKILRERALPSTLSTIELDGVPIQWFRAAVTYIEGKLRAASALDGLEVEVYSARDLSASEKSALERRLARASSKNTIFVIISRAGVSQPSQTVG